jgi:hypothetical protein
MLFYECDVKLIYNIRLIDIEHTYVNAIVKKLTRL